MQKKAVGQLSTGGHVEQIPVYALLQQAFRLSKHSRFVCALSRLACFALNCLRAIRPGQCKRSSGDPPGAWLRRELGGARRPREDHGNKTGWVLGFSRG